MDVHQITVLDWMVVAVLGRLLVFMFHKSPLSGWLYSKSSVLEKIFTCGFCANFWFYLLVISFLRINLTNFTYIPVLTEVFGAVLTAFVVWMFETGYTARFGTISIVGGNESDE